MNEKKKSNLGRDSVLPQACNYCALDYLSDSFSAKIVWTAVAISDDRYSRRIDGKQQLVINYFAR